MNKYQLLFLQIHSVIKCFCHGRVKEDLFENSKKTVVERRTHIGSAKKKKEKRIPAEVQAAGPAEEPVENSSMFQGFLVLPPNQMSSYANDPVTSFATRTAPVDFNLIQQN